MATQRQAALKGELTPAMRRVAEKEALRPEDIQEAVGTIVIPSNVNHRALDPTGIGEGLRTKVNANIGTSALGPIVTDVAPGYDHITSAIGGALTAESGADFLCYVTPAEHLGLPDVEDVREGIIAARIAAHTADLIKRVPGAWEWDVAMAGAREALDWEEQIRLAIDPEKARRYRGEKNVEGLRQCTMCGEYCAMELAAEAFDKREV